MLSYWIHITQTHTQQIILLFLLFMQHIYWTNITRLHKAQSFDASLDVHSMLLKGSIEHSLIKDEFNQKHIDNQHKITILQIDIELGLNYNNNNFISLLFWHYVIPIFIYYIFSTIYLWQRSVFLLLKGLNILCLFLRFVFFIYFFVLFFTAPEKHRKHTKTLPWISTKILFFLLSTKAQASNLMFTCLYTQR